MSASDLRDLFDEHTAIAGQAARLAAERAAPYAVRRLFALTDQLGAASTLGDRIRADSRFHIQVAIASQSGRLARREANLQAEVAGCVWLPFGRRIDVAARVEEQHAIATAIASENAEEARRLAEAHVMGQLRAADADQPRAVGRGAPTMRQAACEWSRRACFAEPSSRSTSDSPDRARRCSAVRAAAGPSHRGVISVAAAAPARRAPGGGAGGMGHGLHRGAVRRRRQGALSAWWQRHNDRVARLRLNFDPTTVDVYDYLQMDWYQLAQRGQAARGVWALCGLQRVRHVHHHRDHPGRRRRRLPRCRRAPIWWSATSSAASSRCCGRPADDAVVVSTERRVITANTRQVAGRIPASELPARPGRRSDASAVQRGRGDAAGHRLGTAIAGGRRRARGRGRTHRRPASLDK